MTSVFNNTNIQYIENNTIDTRNTSKEIYNNFITTLREFSKSEEKLNFYEITRT
jgi:hypothetical protein